MEVDITEVRARRDPPRPPEVVTDVDDVVVVVAVLCLPFVLV